MNDFADAMRGGAQWVIKTAVGWWLNIPSINLASSPAGQIRGYVAAISLVVAVGGVMWGGLRMTVRRKSEPLWDIGTGIARLAVVSALAFALPQLFLDFGDSFSTWVLNSSVSGNVADRFTKLAALGGITAPGAVIFAAIIVMLSGVIQAMLMFLREGGIVILTGVLVLSAAGGINPATKSWFPRVSGWLLGLLFYKPFAALAYASAFALIGDKTDDPRTIFVGLTMMVLTIIAMPVMIKFFSWAAPAAVNAASGSGAAMGAALAGAGVAGMALRGVASGGSAATQASRINSDLGPPTSGSSSGGGGGIGPISTQAALPSGGAGSATAGAASSTAAGSAGAGAGGAAAGGAAAAAGPAAAAVMVADAAKKVASAAKETAASGVTGGMA